MKINPNPSPLEKARRAAGLTRQQLAERSGVSINTLQSCEQGKRNINRSPVEDVLSIAEVLNVPIASILNERSRNA